MAILGMLIFKRSDLFHFGSFESAILTVYRSQKVQINHAVSGFKCFPFPGSIHYSDGKTLCSSASTDVIITMATSNILRSKLVNNRMLLGGEYIVLNCLLFLFANSRSDVLHFQVWGLLFHRFDNDWRAFDPYINYCVDHCFHSRSRR
jgi:hypothetical protein